MNASAVRAIAHQQAVLKARTRTAASPLVRVWVPETVSPPCDLGVCVDKAAQRVCLMQRGHYPRNDTYSRRCLVLQRAR